MPTVVTEMPVIAAPLEPRRKRWTRAECEAMEAAGLFVGQHVELIEGELIDKMGKHRPHVNSLTLICSWLWTVFGAAFVNPEAPIYVAPQDYPTSDPEPDVIVLSQKSGGFLDHTPRPEELSLVVEVADSSLDFDLTVKAGLYARAGIVEYWVIDVGGRRAIVHREPKDGRYHSVVSFSETEEISPLAAPDARFLVRDAFPR